MHYDRGWLSVKAADGGTILQAYTAPRPLPKDWETAMSRTTGRMYYVNHKTLQSTFDRDDPMIPDNVPEPAPAPAPAPAPVSTPTKPATKPKQWKIIRAAKIRSGFEQTSLDRGVANIGDIIEEIESRVNARGVTRVHYDRGWLSVKAAESSRRPRLSRSASRDRSARE